MTGGLLVAEKYKALGRRSRQRRCSLLVTVCALMLGAAWAQGSEPAQNPAQNPPQNPSPNSTPSTAPDSGQRSGQAPAQPLPDAPGEKKEESANPVQAVADKTKDVATAGLKKARDWESGWIAGEYVGRNRKLVTLTREQREEIYLRQTLTTPEAYIKRMFAAGIDQARGVPYQWDDGWAVGRRIGRVWKAVCFAGRPVCCVEQFGGFGECRDGV